MLLCRRRSSSSSSSSSGIRSSRSRSHRSATRKGSVRIPLRRSAAVGMLFVPLLPALLVVLLGGAAAVAVADRGDDGDDGDSTSSGSGGRRRRRHLHHPQRPSSSSSSPGRDLAGTNLPYTTSMTTLQQVVTRAYNAKIADGTWHETFGVALLPYLTTQPFCNGETDAWPVPTQLDVDSDLYNVLQRGKFVCGFVKNAKFNAMVAPPPSGGAGTPSAAASPAAATATNPVLIESGTTPDSVRGLIVDYWNAMIDALNRDLRTFVDATDLDGSGTVALQQREEDDDDERDGDASTPSSIELEWKLYGTADDVLDALQRGEIDAACGRFSPDGTYQVPPNTNGTSGGLPPPEYARSYLFNALTCPAYLSDGFLYGEDAQGGSMLFSEFVSDIQSRKIRSICVSGIPGGELENACTRLNQYLVANDTTTTDTTTTNNGGHLECTGFGPNSMLPYYSGFCQAVWESKSPTSFFRQYDYRKQPTPRRAQYPRRKTSLELAITRVFHTLVYQGELEELVMDVPNLEFTDFCNGGVEDWPYPQIQAGTGNGGGGESPPLPRSDLEDVLTRGVFKCGHLKGYFASGADGTVLLDTRSGPRNVAGVVPAFWDLIVRDFADHYGTPVALEWHLYDSSQDAFTALYRGEVDANCGYWNSRGDWTDPGSGIKLARPLAFSMFQCPTFFETSYIHTPANSSADGGAIGNFGESNYNMINFQSLVAAIDAYDEEYQKFPICVADGEAGGITDLCQKEMDRNCPNAKPTCMGAPAGTTDTSAWAFSSVSFGSCLAVWGSVPPPNQSDFWHTFPQPSKFAPTTFFRSFDYIRRTQTSAPTAAPTAPPTLSPAPTAEPPAAASNTDTETNPKGLDTSGAVNEGMPAFVCLAVSLMIGFFTSNIAAVG